MTCKVKRFIFLCCNFPPDQRALGDTEPGSNITGRMGDAPDTVRDRRAFLDIR